jgi:methylmalonyl-CoA mutase cobalamin-binding domain/chain
MSRYLGVRSGSRRAPVSRFVTAALAGDWNLAIDVATEFLARRGSRATVITDLFQGAQLLIANRWHVGQATAADEYRVAEAISAAMDSLPASISAASVSRRSRVLLATLSPEQHDLGLRLVSAALSDDAWQVDLTIGTGPFELVSRASDTGADLVGISATFLTRQARAQLGAVVRSLHSFGVRVIVGGGAFVRAPQLAQEIGADSVAPDARSAVILARRLRAVRRSISRSDALASGQ